MERLFRPRHIAVFGGGWAENVIEQCRKLGFQGQVWPVHPTRDDILGLPAYRTIADLPEPPDASFIGVNREITIEIVRELSQSGAGGAVCFASGFAEAAAEDEQGVSLQSELIAAAGGMPILGPNCYGFINYLDGSLLWPDQHGGIRVDSGVAIVAQSSNITINMTMQARSLPIGYAVTVGNQAVVSQAEIASTLIEDERVTALGLYIEGFGNPREYEALARKSRALNKPVVVMKTGVSAKSQEVAISHTASINGADAGAAALIQRLGFARAEGMEEFLETLKLLHHHGPLPGHRITSLSCSGGEAGLIADAADRRNLNFPDIEPAAKDRLREALGERVHLANPLDYHTYLWGDYQSLNVVFSAMMSVSADLHFIVVDLPRKDRCEDAEWEPAIAAFEDAVEATGVKAAVISTLAETMPEDWAARLAARGIAPMCSMEHALAATAHAAEIGRAWAKPEPAALWPVTSAADGDVMDEAKAKAMLAEAGLPVPRSDRAETPIEAARAAEAIGFPVALKGLGIAHKTETGAVQLNLISAQAVQQTADDMPAAKGFLVEAMINAPVAELLVGITADPPHGWLLTLGAGGIHAEIAGDRTHLLLPATDTDIGHAISQLRLAPVLAGYRGRPAADMDALVGTIRSLADFVSASDEMISELEINPLIACETGAFIADALIRIRG